jgi:hypothetical protein
MATITLAHLFKNGTSEEGKVGDGATILLYSDSYAVTIIARTAKSITVQEDNRHIASGTWPDFQYTYSRNPDGKVTIFRWSAKKGWQAPGYRLLIGDRRYYQDPTF